MKKTKRKKLGEGYIWFQSEAPKGYIAVVLYPIINAGGDPIPLKIDGLGAWQKVRLYAEYEERKR